MNDENELVTVKKSRTRSLVGHLDLPPEEAVSRAGRPYVSFVFKDNLGKLHDCICIEEKIVPFARNLKANQRISILISQTIGDDKCWVKHISDGKPSAQPAGQVEPPINPVILTQYNQRMMDSRMVKVKIEGKYCWQRQEHCVIDEDGVWQDWLEYTFEKLGTKYVNDRYRIWWKQNPGSLSRGTNLIKFNSTAYKLFKTELLAMAQSTLIAVKGESTVDTSDMPF